MLIILLSSLGIAATHHVDPADEEAHLDLQAAIDVASSGDTITIAEGTHAFCGDLSAKDLTIEGSGELGQTILTGTESGCVQGLVADSGEKLTLRNLNIQGFARGIYIEDGELRLEGSIVQSCGTAEAWGGAILAVGAQVEIVDSTLRSNTSSRGTVYGVESGRFTVSNSSFADNAAETGAALFLDGYLFADVTDSRLESNVGSVGGAVAMHRGAHLDSRDNTYFGNTAGWGGAVELSGGSASSVDDRFEANQSGNGGAISARDSVLTIVRGNFVGNQSAQGGALYLFEATAELRHSVSSGNQSSQGGFAHADGGELRLLDHDAAGGRGTNNSSFVRSLGGAHVVADRLHGTGLGRGFDSADSGVEIRDSVLTYLQPYVVERGTLSVRRSRLIGMTTQARWVSSLELTNSVVCSPERINVLYSNAELVRVENNRFLTDGVAYFSSDGRFNTVVGSSIRYVDPSGHPNHNVLVGSVVNNRPPEGGSYNGIVGSPGFGETPIVVQNPGFVSWDPGANPCEDWDVRLGEDSPFVDAGSPGHRDIDGSRADLGFTGGPNYVPLDADEDGFDRYEDCDDADPEVHPDAVEVCDGVDNDCNGEADEDGALGTFTYYADRDADGFGDAERTLTSCFAPGEGYVGNDLDCDDGDASAHPDAEEIWYDGADQDCDGNDDDQDGDGFASEAVGGPDCDDLDLNVHPDAGDLPDDGVDQDCDGQDARTEPLAEDDEEQGGCSTVPMGGASWVVVGVMLAGLRRRR